MLSTYVVNGFSGSELWLLGLLRPYLGCFHIMFRFMLGLWSSQLFWLLSWNGDPFP